MIKVNLINQFDNNKKYARIVKQIIQLGYRHLKLTEKAIISVVLVSDETIHEMNRTYRDIDKPTDVLSFENQEDLIEIGDVFISIERVMEQAEELEHSFEYELAFIALHGFLHCLGYDHITDEDNTEMNKIQNAIMAQSRYTR